MKKILIVLFCIILVAGGVAALVSACFKLKFKKDELESCCVSTGGGMLGGVWEVKLSREEDGSAVLRVSEKETYAERLVTTTYRVSVEAFDHVRETVVRCNLYAASKRPYSKMRVLDAATTSVSFTFGKGDFRISEEQVLSHKMREGFREVIRYLDTLAVGDGTVTKEAQRATLHLRSGYTLQFVIEDVFDGRLDDILREEREVSAFGEAGIVLASDVQPDVSGAPGVRDAESCSIIYDPESRQIIVLYADCTFEQPVYRLAMLDGYAASAAPLIAEMEGEYGLSLN